MEKIIRLTESDLARIVKRVINEENKKDKNLSKNDLYNKMLEMLQEIVDQIEDGRTYVTVDDIKNLIKEASEVEE